MRPHWTRIEVWNRAVESNGPLNYCTHKETAWGGERSCNLNSVVFATGNQSEHIFLSGLAPATHKPVAWVENKALRSWEPEGERENRPRCTETEDWVTAGYNFLLHRSWSIVVWWTKDWSRTGSNQKAPAQRDFHGCIAGLVRGLCSHNLFAAIRD